MSGVHVSDRKPTPELLRYQVLAQGIDDAATRIAARSIPKSYRFIIGVQMADAASELAEFVDLSLELYPSNAVAANDRKRCYSRAVAKAKTLKRQARLVADGKMTFEQAYTSYQSWCSHVLDMDAHELVLRMDRLFADLFANLKIKEDPQPRI